MKLYQGYKSAKISLPKLIKQGILEDQIKNCIAQNTVKGSNILNFTKQNTKFYIKRQKKS